MKWLKRLFWLLAVLAALGLTAWWAAPYLNDYQTDGELVLAGLRAPVTVKRDTKGMAYIYARNLDDALFAQGFVTAQDRLFQMQLTRLFAQGRICELVGAKAKPLDVRMRTIGIHRLAKRQAAFLDQKTRHFFQRYLDGVNAFIERCPDDVHLEFKLAGIAPEPWKLSDSLSVLYYMGFATSGNLRHEVVAQLLVDKLGLERARRLMPINLNPDDQAPPRPVRLGAALPGLGLAGDRRLAGWLGALPLGLGSNNWVVAPRLSPSGKPILAGDPHLDPRILPGPWYPLGIITPRVRAVGANIPGLPGMVIGRTSHLAMAVTNSYGDVQDLYVETLDPRRPGHYLEGERSVPFRVIEETLKIKDKEAPGGYRQEKIRIRLTRRGPVVSGVLPGLKTDKVITLRWAAAESMLPEIGLTRLLTVESAAQADAAVQQVSMIVLNWVFADTQGNIGWRVSGRIPIRSQGEATIPYPVRSARDNWIGWIPQAQMPHALNPARGWLGTCNHKTVTRDYPYYFSSLCASTFRYARLKQLLDAPGLKPVDAHWRFQRDQKNLEAAVAAPIMAKALAQDPATRPLAALLEAWDFRDQARQAAPLVFQAAYLEFARQVFEDELGPGVTDVFLDDWYFWQERLLRMVRRGASPWFDDIRTPDKTETRDDMFRRAGRTVLARLGERLGGDPASWQWGQVHTLELVSPLRRKGPGKALLGTGPMPMGGSGETLYRAIFKASRPFEVTISAALRMVADLGDEDKVLAVLPGGVSGRLFSPHQTDQVAAYMSGRKLYWWFSDKAIQEHAQHRLVLRPR